MPASPRQSVSIKREYESNGEIDHGSEDSDTRDDKEFNDLEVRSYLMIPLLLLTRDLAGKLWESEIGTRQSEIGTGKGSNGNRKDKAGPCQRKIKLEYKA